MTDKLKKVEELEASIDETKAKVAELRSQIEQDGKPAKWRTPTNWDVRIASLPCQRRDFLDVDWVDDVLRKVHVGNDPYTFECVDDHYRYCRIIDNTPEEGEFVLPDDSDIGSLVNVNGQGYRMWTKKGVVGFGGPPMQGTSPLASVRKLWPSEVADLNDLLGIE